MLSWEYWPSALFYIPNIPYALYLALKARHLAFFSAANPTIFSSGNGLESKFETLQLIPKKYIPKTILHQKETAIEQTLIKIKKERLAYPIIAKPDIGFRGLLVTKIDTEKELIEYLEQYSVAILIQEYIDAPYECGIFYHRKHGQQQGHISSITLKRFLSVTGNGTDTLLTLLQANQRARRYLPMLKKNTTLALHKIHKQGEEVRVSVIGNHSKGTQFIAGNELISSKLTAVLDTLSHQIKGWHYGRIDLKYSNFEALENGEGFTILEINGIISEPTHIYDSETYSYGYALKTIRQHWRFLYEVATENHKQLAVPYKNAWVFLKEIKQLKAYTKKLKAVAKA